MPKFRKKPVVIEAFRYGIDSRPGWFEDRVGAIDFPIYTFGMYCIIHTLEGEMRGGWGDYIIKGVKDELYPCKEEIFRETYELVDEAKS